MLGYLDAGSASLVVQAIVAGAAGAVVFLKLGWRRITSPFRRQTTAEAGSATSAEQPTAESTTLGTDA
jgi:hypothetical protein